MVSSSAASVQEYLNELTPEGREILTNLRNLILKNLPVGYVETMNWGMICYEVPLSIYPDTYNKKPLMYAGLAAQKNHYALYLSSVYQNSQQAAKLQEGFAAAGKKLDMGKSCIRFRRLDQLDLTVIAQIIGDTPLESFLSQYQLARENRTPGKNPSM